jgi:hypothetical protein
MKAIFVLLILSLLAAGCTQPSVQPVVTTPPTIPPTDVTTNIPVHNKPVVVTAERIDSTKILITYKGGPDADQLIELETTVVTGKGSVNIQSMGSRLDTTPVQIGGTDIFRGPYTEEVHVLITGYFANGTHQDFLDTRI